MDQRLRYVFHSHAAAFGGHIVRPKDIVLEAHGASALLVTGGRSVAQLPRTRYDEFFEIESAATFAEGLFEDPAKFAEVTHHRAEENSLTAVTRVHAEVRGFALGRTPRLTITRLRAELNGRSPLGSGEPSIRVGRDVVLEGVAVDGHKLVVELNLAPFQRFDTHAKLLVAADDPAFVKESGDALYMTRRLAGQADAPPSGRLIESRGIIYATLVRSIRWDGDPFPGSQIDHNVVVLPDFGRVFFGELLISRDSRRLTMVRAALGSDAGGSASAGDVQDNGGWSP
jgi:hypothetical protein